MTMVFQSLLSSKITFLENSLWWGYIPYLMWVKKNKKTLSGSSVFPSLEKEISYTWNNCNNSYLFNCLKLSSILFMLHPAYTELTYIDKYFWLQGKKNLEKKIHQNFHHYNEVETIIAGNKILSVVLYYLFSSHTNTDKYTHFSIATRVILLLKI